MAGDTTERLPRYLAPLPRRVETVALQYAWVIVAINLVGTVFGFWYYVPQFRLEPIVNGTVQHVSPARETAAVGAVVLTTLATGVAVLTRREKRSNRAGTASAPVAGNRPNPARA